MEIDNICILGDDGRMDFVAQYFYDSGYEICRDLQEAGKKSVIVLPPPVGEKAVALILPKLSSGQLVYGGAVSNRFKHECKLKKVDLYDYFKWDDVTEKNAYLTACGIIRQAHDNGAMLEGSTCLVTGYGFCGKAIADALAKKKANVDVAVRKKELYEDISSKGYGYVNISLLEEADLKKYSYIFNTVPAMIFSDDVLKGVSDRVMLFDIASAPGGTDFSYCMEHRIYAINSLGIPGKVYPKQAGEIIAKAILDDLNQK